MLDDRPLSSLTFLSPKEVAAFAALDIHSTLPLLSIAVTPEQSYNLALATEIEPERMETLLSACELTTIPQMSEAEARVVTYLGFGSVRRLASATDAELGTARAQVHRATLTRWGVTLPPASRLEELRDRARFQPALRHLPWDEHARAGRRWSRDPLPEESVVLLLRHGDTAIIAGVAAEIRQELWQRHVHALDQSENSPNTLHAEARLGYLGTALALAAVHPDREQQREAVARERREMERRWPGLAEPHRSQGVVEGLCEQLRRATEALSPLESDLLALVEEVRAALLAGPVEPLLLSLGARLERLTKRLLAEPPFLSPYEIAPVLDAGSDLTAYAAALYGWRARRLATEALLLALATVQRQFGVPGSWEEEAALPPSSTLPAVGLPVAALLEGTPQSSEVLATGDLFPRWDAAEQVWEIRLYGYPAEQFLRLNGLSERAMRGYASPSQTTPATLCGTLDPEQRTLTLQDAPLPATWPEALLARALRHAPLFSGAGQLLVPRTLSTLQSDLLHPWEAQ